MTKAHYQTKNVLSIQGNKGGTSSQKWDVIVFDRNILNSGEDFSSDDDAGLNKTVLDRRKSIIPSLKFDNQLLALHKEDLNVESKTHEGLKHIVYVGNSPCTVLFQYFSASQHREGNCQ
jgi:hypothetical protein